MSGRHRVEPPSSRVKRAAIPLGVVLGVLVAAGVTLVGLPSAAATCTGEQLVHVTVAPPAATVLRAAAADYQRGTPVVDGRCVRVEVTARSAAEVTDQLASGQGGRPDLWIPDSSLWAERAQQRAAQSAGNSPEIDIGAAIASTPLVLAAPAEFAAQQGWPDVEPSWTAAISGTSPATIGDPTSTTEGLTSLVLARTLFGNPTGPPPAALAAALQRAGRTAVSDIAAQFDLAAQFGRAHERATTAEAFTASEQAVLAHNRAAGHLTMVAAYPAEGTLTLDYPVVRFGSAGQPPSLSSALDGFVATLRSPAIAARFADAGFRDPHGHAPKGWRASDGVRPAENGLLPTPSAAVVSVALRTWSAINLDVRMLAVIDVSGSMNTKMSDGRTRIQLARDAALAGLSLYPDSTRIGLWGFSTQQSPPNDWVQLAPIETLSAKVGAGTQRQALQVAVARLPSLVHGGTALYDTALAAFRTLRSGFDSARVNTVVLITDGRNDSDHGIDLPTLLTTLRAEQDPAKPVPIIAIGLSADADLNALNQITSATGGKAYQARRPQDIAGVLADALVQRTCRPRC